MRQVSFKSGSSRPGPLAQILSLVLGCLILAVAIFLGALFLAAAVGLGLILAVIIYLRAWWLKRRRPRVDEASEYVEAEYEVIETREYRD